MKGIGPPMLLQLGLLESLWVGFNPTLLLQPTAYSLASRVLRQYSRFALFVFFFGQDA